MADQEYEISNKISWESDDAALKQTTEQLQQVADAQEGANQAAQEHGRTMDNLVGKVASMLTAYLTLAKAWQMIRSGTDEAIRQERMLNNLSQTVQKYGQDGKAAAEATEVLGRRLLNVGISEEAVIDGTKRLLSVTKDYKQALSASSLAADVAIKYNIDYGQAMGIIRNLILDSPRGLLMAKRLLGVEAKTAAEAILELESAARGAASGLDDMQSRTSTATSIMKEAFKDFGKVVGGIFTGVLNQLTHFVRANANAGIEIQYWFRKTFGNKEEAEKWYAAMLKTWKEKFGIPIVSELEKIKVHPKKSDLDQIGKDLEASMKQLMQSVDEAIKEEEETARKALEDERYRDDARDRNLRIMEKRREQAALNAIIGPLAVKAEEEVNQKILASLRVRSAKELQIRKLFLTNVKKLNKQELSDHTATIRMMLQDTSIGLAERNQLTIAFAMARAAAEKQIEAEKVLILQNQQEGAVHNYMSAARNLFGQNKAVGIATAVIDTYVAAVSAMRNTPGPFWVQIAAMVAVLAQGFAQVKAIQSTDIGSGGGVSAGGGIGATPPALVYTGGQPASPPPQNITNVNSTSNAPTNVTINTLTGDGAVNTARQFQRILRPGSRAYDRGIVNRKPVSVGSGRR